MSLAKQAKTLSREQAAAVLAYLTTKQPDRNRLIFLLSIRAGLRAKEIANLTWSMVCKSDGTMATDIALSNQASKGRRGGRHIPLCKELRTALEVWHATLRRPDPSSRVITTSRSNATSAQVIVNLFRSWYSRLGFQGCSSHSGRRTFITNVARKISTVGGSLRDVQALAGHSALSTTQRYIEINSEAKRKIVELVG